MKKILMIGFLILMMTGTAWSNSSLHPAPNGNLFDHLTKPEGLVGDLLIYPVYLADGSGWETKISVINTNTNLSTVAKVVLRGGRDSKELLDFFIYLSPDDMWTGTIYNNNGVVRIKSEDDSVLSNLGVWANETPMDAAVVDWPCDNEEYGYVEVFDAWTISRAALGSFHNLNFASGPIDKDYIFDAFQSFLNSGQTFDGVILSENILTGFFELKLPTLGLSATENAVVFQDYDVDDKLTLGKETFLGESCMNSIAEVEAELSKDSVYLPYYNDGQNISAHVFTYVTKQSQYDNSTTDECDIFSYNSPYFWKYAKRGLDAQGNYIHWCVEYGLKPFDLEENTPKSQSPIFSPVPPEDKKEFCEEVNVLVIDDNITRYDEGWALYTFQMSPNQFSSGDTQGKLGVREEVISYTGAPVIPLNANLGADGLSLKYGAYDPAQISYEYATQD